MLLHSTLPCPMMRDAMTDTPRTPPDATPLTLADAAVRPGISPDAARKRLERGTLHGEKRAGRWLVYLEPDATVDAAHDAGLSAVTDSDRTADAGRTPPDAAVDMAPLAELIGWLTRDNQELAAAAALWQERARFLGEQLQALDAGPIAGDVEDAPVAHEREPTAHERREAFWHAPAGAPTTLRAVIRRLIGRLTRDNQELAAAAALWQERARFLGEQLRALEAGPIAGDISPMGESPQERAVATERDVAGVRASETQQGAQGPAWRRLWHRVTGGG